MAQTTSELWSTLRNTKNTNVEYAFEINGVLYDPDTDAEVSHSVGHRLFDEFGIGNVTVAKLSLKLYADNIPRSATVKRYARLVNGDTVSEWLPKGVFFVIRRAADEDLWSLDAYDALRKAEVVWEPDQSLTFPMTMPDAAAEFCRILGVELDERTVLNSDYTIDYPDTEYTIRKGLSYIAAAHGGNWIMTDEGLLRLVPLLPSGSAHEVGLNLVSLNNNGLRLPVSRVTLWVDDDNCYTSGDDTGLEIVADCPYATQAIVDALAVTLAGYEYQAYTAGAVEVDPAAELGDLVNVGDMASVIAAVSDKGNGYPDISAPGEQELDDEYPDAGPMQREFDRKIAQTRSEISKTAEEIRAAVESTNGDVAALDIKVDSIKMSVTQTTGADGQVYSSIELTVGDNTYTGLILMEGNLNVSGQLSADALYSAKGDIADLAVDKLSTSRRIVKYLAGDTSDDNYIRAENEQLAFVSGVYAEGTEQATTPDGLALYWEQDIEGATLGTDGYPYVDGVRVFTTTGVTDWPVIVYTYTELVKAQMAFEQDDAGNYAPVLTLGAGDGNGYNKLRMAKGADGLEMLYTATSGKEIGITMSEDGYTDIIGQRAVTAISVTEGEDGSVTVVNTLEGDVTEEIVITPDDSGNPKTLTYNGTAIPITWTEASA